MQGKGALRRQGLGPQEGARPGEPAWAWAWAWGGEGVPDPERAGVAGFRRPVAAPLPE